MVAETSASKRKIPATEFFVDSYETSLATDEFLTEICIPTPAAETRSAYVKFGYLERPSVGVALAFGFHNNLVTDVKIAVGCAGPAPRRIEGAEALLNGKTASEAQQLLPQAGMIAGRASRAISDLHGSQEYKEHIVGVLLNRAFQSILS
jgi:carbon-monoxide dehydrogenase medium subunit